MGPGLGITPECEPHRCGEPALTSMPLLNYP